WVRCGQAGQVTVTKTRGCRMATKKVVAENRIKEHLDGKVERVSISAPNFRVVAFSLVGTAPLVTHAFSQKAINIIRETQVAGQKAKKGRKREPKDFEAAYQASQHVSTE